MLRRIDRLFRRYQRTGDPRALGAVFDRTAPELLRVGIHLTRDRHRAEDLLQSTFLTAMERTDRYDPKRPVLPWLVGILANRAREWHRRGQRDGTIEIQRAPATDGDEGDRAGNRELARTCDDALENLPEPYRHVLILHLRHGLSGVEIAQAHGRSQSTVRNQIARGLKLLRRTLPVLGSSAAVVIPTGGRGLASVREAVLARVPRGTGTGAAMTGTSLSLGVLLMSKKVTWSAVGLAAVVGGAWFLQGLRDDGTPGSTVGASALSTALVAEAGLRSEPETASLEGQVLDRTPLEPQADTGSLRVEVLVRDEGTAVAGLPFELWRRVGERGRDVFASGRTAADGVALLEGLSPGGYLFNVFRGSGPWRQISVRIAAGLQETRRIEMDAGWHLRGRVVDPYGRPARNAELRIANMNGPDILLARTEEDGSFAAFHLSGKVTVWAVQPGWQPSKRQELEDRRGTAEIRLVLGGPGVRLTGAVEDERGEPVSDALVHIGVPLSLGSHWEQHELHLFRAGEDGRFEADWLPPGRLFVGALPGDEDRARATSRWVEIEPLGSAHVVLGLGDGASMVGEVRDRVTGQPVQGVQVSARTRDDDGLGPFSHVFADTDERGRYRLEGLIAGVHRVTAQKGNLRVEGEVVLGRGQKHRWETALGNGGSIRVRVLGPDGEALTGWRIELRVREGERWSYQDSALTDGEGLCEFADLRDGEYMVRGIVMAYAVAAFERRGLVPDGREVTVRASSDQMPSARILGRVLDSSGAPVLDAEVGFYEDPGYGVRALLEVDREGRFATELLPPGRYSISARAPASGRVYAHGVYEVEIDQKLDVGDLVIADPARLEVRLVTEDGKSVTNPVLVLGDPRDVTPGTSGPVADEVDGVYRAEGLEARPYELRFFAADALPRTVPFELLPGQTRQLDLRVRRAHPVVLEIRCAEETPGIGLLNGQVTVTDSTGERLVFHRLWGYFDDHESRLARVKLALAPGEYAVDAWQYGGKRMQVGIRVSGATTGPFAIDLR